MIIHPSSYKVFGLVFKECKRASIELVVTICYFGIKRDLECAPTSIQTRYNIGQPSKLCIHAIQQAPKESIQQICCYFLTLKQN